MIQINTKNIKLELDLEEELKIRHLRKIHKVYKDFSNNEIDEFDLIIKLIEVFLIKINEKTEKLEVKKIVEDLTIEEFTDLSEKITGIISMENKKKEIKK